MIISEEDIVREILFKDVGRKKRGFLHHKILMGPSRVTENTVKG
jgi:hypothetical protein